MSLHLVRGNEGRGLSVAMKPGVDASARVVRADVLVLLREKRYEEALALLYRARSELPASAELQKSIDQVKEFLIGAYAKRLGGLDQIAVPIVPTAGRSPDMVLLSRYIDGTSTYGDLAQMCPLGRLRTLQLLVELYPRVAPPTGQPGNEPVTATPHSGPRALDGSVDRPPQIESFDASDERPPDTARSASSAALEVVEDPEARRYKEHFAIGTAAFIRARYEEAVAAFEVCAQLRPGDGAAAVMLRRCRRYLESL